MNYEFINKKSVSVIVTAYNEEKNIFFFLKKLIKDLKNLDYEVIIVNDHSNDDTYKIIKNFSKKNRNIKIINNYKNLGYGGSFKKGVNLSKKNFIILLPGDGETNSRMIFKEFRSNKNYNNTLIFAWKSQNRTFLRKLLSFLYTKIINFSFNMKLKYINGPVFYNGNNLRKLNFYSKSFFFQAEILSRLSLREDFKYKEIDIQYIKPKYYKSDALKFKFVISLIKEYLIHLYRFYLK